MADLHWNHSPFFCCQYFQIIPLSLVRCVIGGEKFLRSTSGIWMQTGRNRNQPSIITADTASSGPNRKNFSIILLMFGFDYPA